MVGDILEKTWGELNNINPKRTDLSDEIFS
jgi:hypothetical protein